MDNFSSIQGRTYELGGLAGAIGALRAFKASKECQQQIARIISRLGEFNLTKIITQFGEENDKEKLDIELIKSAPSILSARLFQGYVQGFCETQQFIKSLPATTQAQLVWVYANPTLGQETKEAFALAQQELSLIADNFNTLNETGKCPYADLLFIVRTYYNKTYQFHLICYEAESLEIKQSKKQSNYKRTEIGAATEVSRYNRHGVFKTITRAIHSLNQKHSYKRIIACVSTQSNRQLDQKTTTVGTHLSKIFGDSHKKFDIPSIEQFAHNIKEIVFFIDEVTGDGAGRQTVQEMIKFRQDVIDRFEDVGKSLETLEKKYSDVKKTVHNNSGIQ